MNHEYLRDINSSKPLWQNNSHFRDIYSPKPLSQKITFTRTPFHIPLSLSVATIVSTKLQIYHKKMHYFQLQTSSLAVAKEVNLKKREKEHSSRVIGHSPFPRFPTIPRIYCWSLSKWGLMVWNESCGMPRIYWCFMWSYKAITLCDRLFELRE